MVGRPHVVYLPDDAPPFDHVIELNLCRGFVTNYAASNELAPLATLASLTPPVRGQRGLGVHWTRGGGFVQLGPHAVADDGTDVAVPGHWVDLDWSQCNRLIRFLRNARDQAFGRPE